MPDEERVMRFTNGDWITCIQTGPGDGTPAVLAASWDTTIKSMVPEGISPEMAQTVELHKDKVNTFAMWNAKTGSVMITGSDDGTVKIFKFDGEPAKSDGAPGKYSVELGNIKLLADIDIGCRVFTIAFPKIADGEDGCAIFVGAGYGTLKLIALNFEGGELKYEIPKKPDGSNPFKAHTADVYSVVYAYDTVFAEKQKQWDKTGGDVRQRPVGNRNLYVISASHDKRVIVWDMTGTPCPRHLCDEHTGEMYVVAAMTDGKRFLSGGQDKTVRVFTIDVSAKGNDATRLKSDRIVHEDSYVTALATLQDNRHALYGLTDSNIKLLDVDKGVQLLTISHHTGPITSIWIDNTRKMVLSASGDGTAVAFELPSKDAISAAEKKAEIAGLKELLEGCGFSANLPAATRWCKEKGITSLEGIKFELKMIKDDGTPDAGLVDAFELRDGKAFIVKSELLPAE